MTVYLKIIDHAYISKTSFKKKCKPWYLCWLFLEVLMRESSPESFQIRLGRDCSPCNALNLPLEQNSFHTFCQKFLAVLVFYTAKKSFLLIRVRCVYIVEGIKDAIRMWKRFIRDGLKDAIQNNDDFMIYSFVRTYILVIEEDSLRNVGLYFWE